MSTARQGVGEDDGAELATRFLSQLLDLEPDQVAMLAAKLEHTRVRGPKGSSFALPGAAACLILEGWLVRSVMLPDGRRQILDFLVPGDVIGVPPGKRAPSARQMINLTPARVATISVHQLEALQRQSSRLAFALLEALARTSDRLADQVLRLGRLGAYERTAHLLLELLVRLQRAGLATKVHYPLPVTQEELADALGLSSVHLNRVVRAMTREGLVEIHGRAARTLITVLDVERLAEIAMYDLEQPR
jgi:CRP-like cAMP-binding protein